MLIGAISDKCVGHVDWLLRLLRFGKECNFRVMQTN